MLRLIVLAVLLTPIFGQNPDIEKRLLDQILDKSKYDPRIRPVVKEGNDTAVVVTTNFYVRDIDYVCTKEMEWKTQITFRQQWNDDRLKYDDQSGKIKYLSLTDETKIWRPDVFFSNSKKTERMEDLMPNVLIRIYPNGNVLYSTRLNTVLSCPMDLKHYPFDSQTCSLRLASYGYTTEDIIFLWKEGDPVQVTKNLMMPGFTLTTYRTNYCTSRTQTGEYSCQNADFVFKRESSKYICQWFLPTAFLTFISFASFCLKNKSCRVRLLLAILVLLYLHILYINNKAPNNISYTNAKDCWVSTCIFFVLAAAIELAIVRIVDRLSSGRRTTTDTSGQNGKTHCEEGDAVALKPLVEEGKDEQKEEDSKQYTVNKTDRRTVVQKWNDSSISCRIDLISAILFPLLFIVYIITFFAYETLRE